MKKVILILCSLLLVMSCTSSLADRFEKHVQKVEANFDKWTEKDWERFDAKYEDMVSEYKENFESYTVEEIATINKAISEYKGLCIKNKMRRIGDGFKSSRNDSDNKKN